MLQQIIDLINQRIDAQVASAVEAFNKAHPDADPEALDKGHAEIRQNIVGSAIKTKLMNSKSMRQARRDISLKIIEDSKFQLVKFDIERECEKCKSKVNPDTPLPQILQDVLGMVFPGAQIVSSRYLGDAAARHTYTQQVRGAIKYDYNVEKGVDLLAVFTYLNPADQEDELIATENIAERIQSGQFLRIPLEDGSFLIEGIGDKLDDLAHQYLNEFLRDTSHAKPKAEAQPVATPEVQAAPSEAAAAQ